MMTPEEPVLMLLRETTLEPPLVFLDDPESFSLPDAGSRSREGGASGFTPQDRERVLREAWEIVFGPEDRDPVIVLSDHEFDSLFS
jgi:hypothetical protein